MQCSVALINFECTVYIFSIANMQAVFYVTCMMFVAPKLEVVDSDCNPGIEFSIPGFGIETFVIPGSRFRIKLIDWLLFWYLQ